VKLYEIKPITETIWGVELPVTNSRPFPSALSMKRFFYRYVILEDWADASSFDTDDIPSFDKSNSREMGTFDNHSIWMTKTKKEQRVVGIIKDGKTLAYLGFDRDLVKINGVEYSKTIKAWTSPDNRKQGLQLAIHAFLLEKLGIPIISDDKFSQAGLGLLKQLVNNHRFNVQFYNQKTKEIVDKQPDNLFHPPNDWQVLLNANLKEGSLFADGRKWDGGSIWSEMTLYRNGNWD
jgi:hypothetical protein